MKNKIKFKKYLVITFITTIILLTIFLIINIMEYKIYNDNYNNKLSTIISHIINEYPKITTNEIMNILNSDIETNKNIFKKYSIDLNKESLILENEIKFKRFTIINIIYLLLVISIFLTLFIVYEKKKDKEINEITKYIEEINKRNYQLHIDEISEDELSILKNEIYKTTVMLKENAENSINDKRELKKSLEDISHQLKTPLTSIILMLDNLIDDPYMDNNIKMEFITDIKREVNNINFLVQSILKLSKFDSNTIDFIKEKIKVKDIINTSIKNISPLSDLKNIKIEVNGNEESQIYCDYKWQVEAITNILKNSIDHSKEYEKVIVEYKENNVYTEITIEDFGSGISKKDLPHIFERFYKSESSRKDSIGIGLSLSKTIIEKDNGIINVETNPNGTKFIIKYFK